MAENDFLSGLLGGVKDVGSSIYGGISGLLGGGEQTPAAGGQMQDSMSMLSPADQKRLMFSTLGQVGAALLAAGARQSPESRAQALAQLGKIGPGIEESIQRNAAFQQQRIAAQRQNELFPIQLAAARAGLAQQNIGQAKSVLELQGQATNLQRQIATYDQIGLTDQANAARGQLANIQQVIRSLPSGGGAPAGAPAPAMGQTLPTMAAPAAIAPAQPAVTTVPAPAQIAGTELPPPVEGAPAPMVPVPAVPAPPAAQAPALSPFQQYVKTNLPFLKEKQVQAVLTAKGDPNVAMAELIKMNEEAQQQQFKNERDIRQDFVPVSTRFGSIQTAFGTLSNLKNLDTGIADEALVMQFFKIFDPTSVISQNEAGRITSATGAVDRYGAQAAERLISGKRLTPEMRSDLIAAAKTRFDEEYKSYEKTYDQSVKNSSDFGLNPERTVPDVRDPKIMGQITFERERDAISKSLTPDDISKITNTTQLENVNKALLSPAARKLYDAKYKELYTQMLEVPPPVAPAGPGQPYVAPRLYDFKPWTAANPNKPAFGGF